MIVLVCVLVKHTPRDRLLVYPPVYIPSETYHCMLLTTAMFQPEALERVWAADNGQCAQTMACGDNSHLPKGKTDSPPPPDNGLARSRLPFWDTVRSGLDLSSPFCTLHCLLTNTHTCVHNTAYCAKSRGSPSRGCHVGNASLPSQKN